MAKRKLLNGLPNDLSDSFFYTLNDASKGYMSDWIEPIIYNISGLKYIVKRELSTLDLKTVL